MSSLIGATSSTRTLLVLRLIYSGYWEHFWKGVRRLLELREKLLSSSFNSSSLWLILARKASLKLILEGKELSCIELLGSKERD